MTVGLLVHLRGADGALLVYDVARRATFENIPRWLGEARNNSHNDALKMILVGAKADQGAKRQVGAEEAAAFARKHGMVFVETSSKTAFNVDEAFLTVTRDIYRTQAVAGRNQPGRQQQSETVNLKASSARKKKGGAGCLSHTT